MHGSIEWNTFPSPVNGGFGDGADLVRRPSSDTFDQNKQNSLAINVQAPLVGTELPTVVIRIRSALAEVLRAPEQESFPRLLTRCVNKRGLSIRPGSRRILPTVGPALSSSIGAARICCYTHGYGTITREPRPRALDSFQDANSKDQCA